jgi:hypothetical protein
MAMLGALAPALLLFLAAPASLRAQPGDIDISVFYEELEPYGRWFTHPRYGHVWAPDVDDDWRPYSRGYWVFTDDHGWYWESEEPWGWAVFHYGRWVLDDEYGYVWIPGTEWGPAWVAWRYDDEYVGWAPLPPEAEWYEDRGLTFSASYYDAPRYAPLWVFVAPRYMTSPGLYRYALHRGRNRAIIGRTRWATSYRMVDRRIFNAGFDVRHYERITRRPVARVRILSANSPRGLGFEGSDRRTLRAYRPRLIVGANPPRPPRLSDPPRRRWGERGPGNERPGTLPREKSSFPPHHGAAPPTHPGGGGAPPSQRWKAPPQTGLNAPPKDLIERPQLRQRQTGPHTQPQQGPALVPRPAPHQARQPGHPPPAARGGDGGRGETAKKKRPHDPNEPPPGHR